MTNHALLVHDRRSIDERSWASANKEIVWCWKRDQGMRRRTIFFSGELERLSAHRYQVRPWSFYYEQRAETDAIEQLHRAFEIGERRSEAVNPPVVVASAAGYSILRISSPHLEESARRVIARLRRRRPRSHLPQGRFPVPAQQPADMQALAPVVVYAGSGLSYESKLPTLAEIHNDFGVDDFATQRLLFGLDDPIPGRIARNAARTLARFARFHLSAAAAAPSASYHRIADLHERGLVSTILTDNVDNLFAKCELPFVRTRTVFPERFQHRFAADERTLLVIGVAADRRQIIAQARRRGMRIVVVNPYRPVSPGAQNLSYLRGSDLWYRCTASEFFARCCRAPWTRQDLRAGTQLRYRRSPASSTPVDRPASAAVYP